MKYVILREPDGNELPVFALAPTAHSEIVSAWSRETRGGEAVSAGFLRFMPHGVVETYGRSETLRLGPRTEDAALITAMLRATQQVGTLSIQTTASHV